MDESQYEHLAGAKTPLNDGDAFLEENEPGRVSRVVSFDWDALNGIKRRPIMLSKLTEREIAIGSVAITKLVNWIWAGGQSKTLLTRAAVACWALCPELQGKTQRDVVRELDLDRNRFAHFVIQYRDTFGVRTPNMRQDPHDGK